MKTEKFERQNFWFLAKEGSDSNGDVRYSIRRKNIREDETFYYERRPLKEFVHLTNEQDLKDFVVRLNGRAYQAMVAKKTIEAKHAWITPKIRDEFKEELEGRIANTKDANYAYGIMISKFLKFFLDLIEIKDPREWKKYESEWGHALMNRPKKEANRIWDKNFTPSAKTLKSIIHVSNQFLDFLCKKYPEEYQYLKLDPISRAQMSHHEALRIHDDVDFTRAKYISHEHWETIKENLPFDIRPFVLLGYYYGLRRSECLGVLPKDLRKDFLSVERQVASVKNGTPKTKPLKDRENRKTPHWIIKPETTYEIIEEIERVTVIHPDTFSVKWSEFMEKLGFDYQLHDLRRTFITNCFRLPPGSGIGKTEVLPTDIQLAVGHENIATTMKYKQDDRQLNEDRFIPENRRK
jgi:integrase